MVSWLGWGYKPGTDVTSILVAMREFLPSRGFRGSIAQ
jgi:hypothetical protein